MKSAYQTSDPLVITGQGRYARAWKVRPYFAVIRWLRRLVGAQQ